MIARAQILFSDGLVVGRTSQLYFRSSLKKEIKWAGDISSVDVIMLTKLADHFRTYDLHFSVIKRQKFGQF